MLTINSFYSSSCTLSNLVTFFLFFEGLSEVIAGIGIDKLNVLLPDIIKTAETPDIPPHVRDGYIMMFIYLPGTFGDLLTPFIGQLISPILLVILNFLPVVITVSTGSLMFFKL